MKTLLTYAEWKTERAAFQAGNMSVGLVPTMGALHEGHVSLIKKSRQENHVTVVSIYVNPTQFNDPDDFKKYPLTLENDRKILEELGVDFLFLPDYSVIYPDGFTYFMDEKNLSRILCGASRPGHFRGVLTVVMKLLNIIKPNRAYFGEKDFQQFLLIKGMVEAFFVDTEIIPCPTIRDENGLALSSRNLLLDEDSKLKASGFNKILSSPTSKEEATLLLEKSGFIVDYIEEFNNRRFGAVIIDGIRLIDNVQL